MTPLREQLAACGNEQCLVLDEALRLVGPGSETLALLLAMALPGDVVASMRSLRHHLPVDVRAIRKLLVGKPLIVHDSQEGTVVATRGRIEVALNLGKTTRRIPRQPGSYHLGTATCDQTDYAIPPRSGVLTVQT